MPYESGTATDYLDLLDRIRRFAAGYGIAGAPTPGGSNVGDGTVTGVDTTPSTVTETITLTCTATAADSGTFSVSGSVTGALPDATVGVPYTSSVISFTINDGATDFAVGDSFTIATTQGQLAAAGVPWVEQRWTGGNELILMGQGDAGTEQIYVGIQAFEDVGADYYNFELRGMVGYVSGSAFDAQPGTSGPCYVHLWNSAIPYWLVANGNRIICVAKVSTVYEVLHLGYILPFGTPGQYPYPLLVGGMSSVKTLRFSDTSDSHSAFFNPGEFSARLYWVDGTWYDFTNKYPYTDSKRKVWPWVFYRRRDRLTWMRDNIDGSYVLIPATLAMESGAPSANVIGEIDGVYFVSGFNNGAENLINIGGIDHLVVQNAHRTNIDEYMALRLD